MHGGRDRTNAGLDVSGDDRGRRGDAGGAHCAGALLRECGLTWHHPAIGALTLYAHQRITHPYGSTPRTAPDMIPGLLIAGLLLSAGGLWLMLGQLRQVGVAEVVVISLRWAVVLLTL